MVLDEMKKAHCLFTRRQRGLTVLCNPWNLCFLEAYRDQEPSPDHSSGSESGSESSGSQSASSSGSSSSSEEASREGSVHGALPPPEPPQGLIRSSSLCLRNILARSGGRVAFFFQEDSGFEFQIQIHNYCGSVQGFPFSLRLVTFATSKELGS